MRVIFGLRSDRNPGVLAEINSGLSEYSDGDGLTAAGFNSRVSVLDAFSDSWAVASHPVCIYPTEITNLTSSTSLTQRTDRIPGSGYQETVAIVGRITMSGVGAALQTVTISYGYGTASSSTVISVAAQSIIDYSVGSLLLTATGRSVTNSADDFVITFATNGATTVSRVTAIIANNAIFVI
jgi:hypothetical protein